MVRELLAQIVASCACRGVKVLIEDHVDASSVQQTLDRKDSIVVARSRWLEDPGGRCRTPPSEGDLSNLTCISTLFCFFLSSPRGAATPSSNTQDMSLRPFEAKPRCKPSTEIQIELYTRTCGPVWLLPSQDPLVGKAQAQRGLNAIQVHIVLLGLSVTLRS